MWFFRSPNIVFGEDALTYLNGLAFHRVLIVTDSNIQKAGLVDMVKEQLPESSESSVIADIPEEPTLSEITERISRVNKFQPDLIIGLGGGSSMDAAKTLFVLYERPDLDIYDITPLVSLDLRKKSRLFLIPTTSGTGSECTWAAVLSDDDHHRKNELASPEIIADYAIIDPALVARLPAGVTRNTAVDAITHAIEGATSQWKNVYSDIFAGKAMELISHNLPEVLRNPGNIEAREQVHIGASMAGVAFSNSQIGLAHALGHSLGAVYKVPHGMAVGLFLPGVVDFSEEFAGPEYSRLNSLIPEKFRKSRLGESLREFFRVIGQPLTIEGCGITAADYRKNMETLVELASESTGVITNPREAETSQIQDLFEGVMGGK